MKTILLIYKILLLFIMPCTACGKNGSNTTKPKSMILGMQRKRTVRTVQRPRGLILNIKNKTFLLGRR